MMIVCGARDGRSHRLEWNRHRRGCAVGSPEKVLNFPLPPKAAMFSFRQQKEVRNFFRRADGANRGDARPIRVSDFGRHENRNRSSVFLIHYIASLKMQSFPNQNSVLPCPTLPRDAIV